MNTVPLPFLLNLLLTALTPALLVAKRWDRKEARFMASGLTEICRVADQSAADWKRTPYYFLFLSEKRLQGLQTTFRRMDRHLYITQSAAEPWRFSPSPGAGAYSLLLITLAGMPRAEKNRIAAEIIASDARNIACWGVECADWHNTLDWAYLPTSKPTRSSVRRPNARS